MKRVKPDLEAALKASFISTLGSTRRFKRQWGTETVDGVEVFSKKRYIYPYGTEDKNLEKLLKFLGIYDDIRSQSYKGVDNAWLYLNPAKGFDLEPSQEILNFVKDNLNLLFWNPADGNVPNSLKIKTSITAHPIVIYSHDGEYNNDITTYLYGDYVDAFKNNYEGIFSSFIVTHEDNAVLYKGTYQEANTRRLVDDVDILHRADPWLTALSRYALLYPTDIATAVTRAYRSYITVPVGDLFGRTLFSRKIAYVANIEIPYTVFTADSPIVAKIAETLTASYYKDPSSLFTHITYKRPLFDTEKAGQDSQYSNTLSTKQLITKEITYEDNIAGDDLTDYQLRPYTVWADVAPYPDNKYTAIWYSKVAYVVYGSDSIYHMVEAYLKVDAYDNPAAYGFTKKELFNYVLGTLDSDFKKKKVGWFKSILTAVIVLVAIYFFGPVAGFIFASIALTVISLIAEATGDDELALAASQMNQMIEPLVKIASIINIVNVAMKMYSAAAEASKEAAKELGKEAAKEITIQEAAKYMIDNAADKIFEAVMKGATDLASGTVSNASLSFASNILKLFMMPQQIKLAQLQSKNKALQAEAEELAAEETARESNVLKSWSRIYASPAKSDWSIYAEKFDLPYERGGGNLAIGNIQRTTKRALRKGDYTLPVFDNIIGV